MPSATPFLAQDADGQRFDRGLHGERGRVIGVDPDLGLAVLAWCADAESASARLAAEILLDDMQANLQSITHSEVVEEAPGLTCLRESLDNIAEYLREEGGDAVSLAALQIDEQGRANLALAGEVIALARRQPVLRLDAGPSAPLGAADPADPLLIELPTEGLGCLLLLTMSDEAGIGPDYVQVSLGRFCDAPDMLLRQLGVRAQRQGLEHAPMLVHATLPESSLAPARRGLFGRLLRR